MCCYSKIIPTFRSDDVTPVSMDPPNTELLNYLDGGHRKIHNAVQFQNNIPSVTYLVAINCKLYCLMSNVVAINTTRIKPNMCTCICYTESGSVTNLICNCNVPSTMTNSCIPHNLYMKGHATFASYCYIDTDNDSSRVTDIACHGHSSFTMTNPCVPHNIYMRDHDTYDDICGGK